MASAPPRTRLRSSITTGSISYSKSAPSLRILQQMGFTKLRAEKAIASTGNKDVSRASEWLLSHVDDPKLDDMEPREYILYLFPTGEFLGMLMDFWETTLQVCGWNSAHLYHPHITLCSFFPVPHSRIDVIDKLMAVAAEEVRKWPQLKPIEFGLFTQKKNFIGYFLLKPHHGYLEQLMATLQKEASKYGLELKPQAKQMHLTLAFQYDEKHHDLLMKLAEEMDPKCEAVWEIRAYSREAHTKMAEVRKVIKSYTPMQEDELALEENGYVYMEPEEHERSPDGWFRGTLHKTGESNLFPGNFTIKSAQMEIWVLHRHLVLPFHPYTPTHNDCVNDAVEGNYEEKSYDNIWNDPREALYAKVRRRSGHQPRQLFVLRHAERCDFAFFRTWFDKSFDESGTYTRFNLNCPPTVVNRTSFKDFKGDCPLTEIGKAQARITGEALLEAKQTIAHVFCSPSLRCVETVTEMLKAMGSNCKICIEPVLFEWMGWHRPNIPSFIPPGELAKLGFPVDASYQPYFNMWEIAVNETVDDYYSRTNRFVKDLLKRLKSKGGNILLGGHSGTPDAATRWLQGRPLRSPEEFKNIVRGCPYCFLATAQEDMSGQWALCKPPIPNMTHLANKDYKWETLID